MLPKSYPGVPAGTPIVTDPNHIPDGAFVYQLGTGHGAYHDPESGETRFFDSNGQPTNRLEFLDAHAKGFSFADPKTFNINLTSPPPRSLPPPEPNPSSNVVDAIKRYITPVVVPGGPPDKKTPLRPLTMKPPTSLRLSKPNRSVPFGLGEQFAEGTAPKDNTFHSGDPMTEQLRHDDFIQTRLRQAQKDLHDNSLPVGKRVPFQFGLGGLKGLGTLVGRDAPTVLSGGELGNLTSTFLGSYDGHYKVVKNDPKNRTALLQFHVENATGMKSATRIPISGYGDNKMSVQDMIKKRKIGVPSSILNDRTSGPGRTIKEKFDWYEQVHY